MSREEEIELIAPHMYWHVQDQLPHPALADLSVQAGCSKSASNWKMGEPTAMAILRHVSENNTWWVTCSNNRLSQAFEQALTYQGKSEPVSH